MRLRRTSGWFVLALAAFLLPAAAADDWKPAPGNLLTAWAAKVDPKHPLPEYPRPQMVREEWTNLNGLWDYAIHRPRGCRTRGPAKYDGRILVPFCVESALSGVKKPLTDKQWLWYRRSFTSPGPGRRQAVVAALRGRRLGIGRYGQRQRSRHAPRRLRSVHLRYHRCPQREMQTTSWSSGFGTRPAANGEPHGKQHFNAIKNPGGIMYTPCSGIWQTVWLEAVPAVSIESLKMVPDIDAGTAASCQVNGSARSGGRSRRSS